MTAYDFRQGSEPSETEIAHVLEHAPDAMIVADPRGTIVIVNSQTEHLFGYKREQLEGKPIELLVPARLREKHARHRHDFARDPRPRAMGAGGELTALRQDGTEFPAELSLSPMRGRSVHYTVVAVRDISDRKRAEEALRRTEAQLRQAQKMEAIGCLAGGVAHDFNNLLSVILSYANLALESMKVSDPVRSDVDEIRRAAERAADLTRQLLAFSRQQMLEPKVIVLGDVVRGVENLLRRLLDADIDLTLVLPPSHARIHADPTQIEQVVINLAVNARDAMPQGGKLVIETADVELDADYVAHHVGVTPGHYVMLAVTDTGIGMDAGTTARIFEPFFTTKGQGKGTGLGLSMVYGIVQQSGGHIWVYSEPGNGTTFKVYLPESHRATTAPHPAEPPPRSLRGLETVLVVEDQEQVRALTRTVLTRNGYTVLEARDGMDALRVSEEYPEKIDLLLTDVIMPQMSGKHLADRLVALRPNVKVLYMSGYTDNSVIRRGVLEAGVAFLQKPVTPASLLGKVRNVLDNRS